MATNSTSLWDRFQQYYLRYDDIGFTMDISRMRFADSFLSEMESKAQKAFSDMEALEKGAISNPDEKRRVGHYWLRQSSLAPEADLKAAIDSAKEQTIRFAADVHAGRIASLSGKPFTDVLIIGIGGSALGPQLVADALGSAQDKMQVHFLDNTDPDGIDKVFDCLGRTLQQTLAVVISKSGGTKETRNGMLEAKARFEAAGIPFGKHAVAITGEGSDLDKYAIQNGWLARFPMWDWVGGRTSIMSTVGLVPAALQGLDIDGFLSGAAAMDARTRIPKTQSNAAMLLALMWYYAGDGRGKKDMVILPYKDRLVLFSKYLQQLVMESIGKEKDLDNKTVCQGIAVYGNKGSTDQHAYVQQLRDGVNNFFATFIEVRRARAGSSMEVEPGAVTGDYLQGFLRGTRAALYENNRDSITLSIPEVTAYHLGALIGLYERAVGFYAALVNINAYHQPGVEAGKKAATRLLQLQEKVLAALSESKGNALGAAAIASKVSADPEEIYHLLVHLASNGNVQHRPAAKPSEELFSR